MSKSAQLAAATGALLALSLLVLIWSQIQRNREQAALARSTRTEMERVFPGLAPSQERRSLKRDVARYWEQASQVQDLWMYSASGVGSSEAPPILTGIEDDFEQRMAQWEAWEARENARKIQELDAHIPEARRNIEHFHQVCDPLVTERVRALHAALGALLEAHLSMLLAERQDIANRGQASGAPTTASSERMRLSAAVDELERQKQLLGIQ